MKEVLEILRARALRPDLPYVLATVVKVEGSSYRKPGARMLISAVGRLAGSVSGGCLERDVISRGLEVLLSGEPHLVIYDTTDQDDLAFGTSLGCEGRIEILIEPLRPGEAWPLAEIVRDIQARGQAAAVATIFRQSGLKQNDTGRQLAFFASSESEALDDDLGEIKGLKADLVQVLALKLPVTRTYEVNSGHQEMLLERIAPPLPVILFGGGHDVPPLVRLAKEMGHEVTVVDRRVDFAEPQRFPGADRVIHAKPDQVGGRVKIEEGAAVVVMNHHYETDAELLGILLRSRAGYLGMLGPRRRTEKILGELGQSGLDFTASELKKLHAPAGLDLGSDHPEQIALCILAEIQAAMNSRPGGSLGQRFLPVSQQNESDLNGLDHQQTPCVASESSS